MKVTERGKRLAVSDVVCISWKDVFGNEDTTLADAVAFAKNIKPFRAYGEVMHIGEDFVIIAHETTGDDDYKSNLETIPLRIITDIEILKRGRPGFVLQKQSVSSQRVRSLKKMKDFKHITQSGKRKSDAPRAQAQAERGGASDNDAKQ